MAKFRKTMEELRRNYEAGDYAEKEMARRQAVVKETLETKGLTLHQGTALAKTDAAQTPKGAPTAFTIGVGSEIRIEGIPHILTRPGPGAGTWYNTEGDLIDVHAAVQDGRLDTAAHRENPGDAKAKEVYERDSSAEAMRRLSEAIKQHALTVQPERVRKRIESPEGSQGFIRRPQKRLALPPRKKPRGSR